MKERTLMSLGAAGAIALLGLFEVEAHARGAESPDASGKGWSMTRLDLDVRVLPDEERLELDGSARLRLDAFGSSSGPNLLINMCQTDAGGPVMQFTNVTCSGADVNVRAGRNGWVLHVAEIRFDEPKSRADEIVVGFTATSVDRGSQLIVDDDVAIASWTTGWHPFTNPSAAPGVTFHAGTLHAPGETRLHLPAGWIGIVDGSLTERTRTDAATIEVWETPDKIARGFAAGPYSVATEEVDGRAVHVYMQSEDKAIGPERLARLISEAMAAQEARLAPFPFDSYSVVEVPWNVPGQSWGAASQQTFIIAKSTNFDYEHGNLPLWAHELSHGWWGNTVGHQGPGALWCGETLAQVGALISIEALEGPEALREFLAFSRDGYSPTQCAAGYFSLLRHGQDQPLAQLSSGFIPHELADSKGMWVYHMLRHVIGDEAFFGVLRGVIEDYTHDAITVALLRERFIAAAPDHDLRTFFEQWLDRTGAPILAVDWFAKPDGDGLILELEQVQPGDPFVFDLDVEVELHGGERIVERVAVGDPSHSFVLTTPARPVDIRLDPYSKMLIWRPEYGPRPDTEFTGGSLPPDHVVKAVVGSYRLRETEKEMEFFERDGAIYVRTKGRPEFPLLYKGGGEFQVDVPGVPMIVEFDLSSAPASSVKSIESGNEYVADRIDG